MKTNSKVKLNVAVVFYGDGELLQEICDIIDKQGKLIFIKRSFGKLIIKEERNDF